MQLWLLGGGILGGVVGYISQPKKNKNMGAVAGAGIGALAGMALKWQYESYQAGRQALAPYAQEGAARVGAAATAAGQALTTPSYQQLPSGKGAPSGVPTYAPEAPTTKGVSPQPVGVTGTSVESLLDEAGIPGGEDTMDLLMDNPFMNSFDLGD